MWLSLKGVLLIPCFQDQGHGFFVCLLSNPPKFHARYSLVVARHVSKRERALSASTVLPPKDTMALTLIFIGSQYPLMRVSCGADHKKAIMEAIRNGEISLVPTEANDDIFILS